MNNVPVTKSVIIVIIGLFNALICLGQTIEIDGINRDYIFYKPFGIQPNAPLVFVFHGYSGSALGIKNYSKFNLLAEEYGFAVCYPQGTKDQWGNTFWQVGYSFHSELVVDDVKFVRELALKLQDEHNLDTERTFSTGMSNGGDMSYYLACKAPEMFAAVAPVAGCIMQWYYNDCDNDVKMPVFAIHGTNDDITWWNGDINDTQGYGPYLGVRDAINFWKSKNETTTEVILNLPNKNINDGSTVVSYKYSGSDNFDVWLYEVTNGGHDWPGSSGNKDIDASFEVWNFFGYVMGKDLITGFVQEEIRSHTSQVHVYPNPFREFVTIDFDSDVSGNTSIIIYSMDGRLVVELFRGMKTARPLRISWDGKDRQGVKVSQGGYVIKILTDKRLFTRQFFVSN